MAEVCVTYWGDPETGRRSDWLYCLDNNQLYRPEALKKVRPLHYRSNFYYDLEQEALIDFSAVLAAKEENKRLLEQFREITDPVYRNFRETDRQELDNIRPASESTTKKKKGWFG